MIDLNELEEALARMKPRQQLYEVVKKQLTLRGRWKNLKRGKSFKPESKDERRGR